MFNERWRRLSGNCLLVALTLSIVACSRGESKSEDSTQTGNVAQSRVIEASRTRDQTGKAREARSDQPLSPRADVSIGDTITPDTITARASAAAATATARQASAAAATATARQASAAAATATASPSIATVPSPTQAPNSIATGEPHDDEDGLLENIKRSARDALLQLVPDWEDAGRINILLLGIDKQDIREGNTDVMMLASIDPATRSALLLSIPRDLCLNECETYLDRLNGIYERDGPDVLKGRISEILGLPVDFYAAVNFNGFAEAIDLLGGIEFWVERDFDELFEFIETREQLRLRLDRGWHDLTGRDVLLLARSRKFDAGGDFARICRHQQIVRQIREKALSIQIVPRIPELMIGLGDWFETDFPALSMPSFAELAMTIPSSRLHSRAITKENGMLESAVGDDGANLLRPDMNLIRDFVDEALLQSISDKPSGVAIHCPTPAPR